MALLGEAAVAMWWDVEDAWRAEFEHWHTHEHFPERMGIPGFLRGSRWASDEAGPGFFVMYELDRYETLGSAGYLARLNNPSPWSAKLMPQHRHMVRSQCRVIDSIGGGLGRCALTLRLSPQPGRDEELRGFLVAASRELAERPGFVAGHLLRTATPPLAVTAEQEIRGGPDRSADWIYVATAYAGTALRELRRQVLGDAALREHGAGGHVEAGHYLLSCAATPADYPKPR